MRIVNEKNMFENKRILVFGRGKIATDFFNAFPVATESVIGFVESKKSADQITDNKGELSRFTGKPIFSVNELPNLEFDFIFVANYHYKTLEETLTVGIPEEKIYIASEIILEEYLRKYPNGKIRFALFSVMSSCFQTKTLADPQIAEQDENFFLFAPLYVRNGTLQLLADEIRDRNILGEIAELGVYKGDTSAIFNRWFPDRTLNLFDTFEGYVEKELDDAVRLGFANQASANSLKGFNDSSIELVMSKMKYPERVKIYKGLFPDTIPEEEKQFALVLIDVSFYIPTLAGLKYFYPRLSTGGYLVMQSYNAPEFSEGNRRAIAELEKEFGHVVKIPIPDKRGTVIISK
ncbi:MAG: hypothetical protein IJ575_00885 [Selenomonadaceae bacterium]|nr:hypothetical protein [Selenomonadaceae bacterium]